MRETLMCAKMSKFVLLSYKRDGDRGDEDGSN